ncbi:hypothetical protein H7100_00980 [Candidatus Saccharibacteria bacterium]|nr:hypothetical protein [Candidatus Saccharibacteria bacterium]
MIDNAGKVPEEMNKKRYSFLNKRVGIYALIIAALIVVVAGGWYGYLYASTPEHIRKPTFQHYHFRTQILVDGQSVDFSKDEFQKETPLACSAAVGSTPIDFHDKMNQLTHVHWNGMTGGEFLKYFGWNYIGGNDDLMGRRYDAGFMPSPVKIFDKLLPSVSKTDTFYVYAGDKDNYQKKSWDEFLNQDLETFFGKKSNVGHSDEVSSSSVLDWLLPKAYAHGAVMDEHTSNKSEEELTRINNLIGNVVIFAQEKEPTKEQIKSRFDNLVPLNESTCGE